MINSSADPDGILQVADTDVVVDLDSVRFTPSGTGKQLSMLLESAVTQVCTDKVTERRHHKGC